MKLTMVLADAELELAPVGRERGMRELPILDAYFHADIIESMPECERRGRGDIVHNSLQLLQDSALNRRGDLRIFIHTREDKVITVDPQAVIAPNYIKFLDQMGRLLKGEGVDGYFVSDKDIRRLIGELDADLVVAMSPHGGDMPLNEVLVPHSDGSVVVIIGAFPAGDYRNPVYELSSVSVSLGPELLTVPEVIRKVLSAVPE